MGLSIWPTHGTLPPRQYMEPYHRKPFVRPPTAWESRLPTDQRRLENTRKTEWIQMSPAISTKDMETKVKTYSRRHVVFLYVFFWGVGMGWWWGKKSSSAWEANFVEISLINPGRSWLSPTWRIGMFLNKRWVFLLAGPKKKVFVVKLVSWICWTWVFFCLNSSMGFITKMYLKMIQSGGDLVVTE